MSAIDIYPRTFYAYDRKNFVDCPALAKLVWMRLRKEPPLNNITWYAVDFTLIGPRTIDLRVYDMHNAFSGGIGNLVHSEQVSSFTKDEEFLLDNCIDTIMYEYAEEEFEKMQDEIRKAGILKLKKDLFNL